MYKKLKNKKFKFIFGLFLLITINLTSIPSFLTLVDVNTNKIQKVKSSGAYEDILIDDLPSSSTNWSWAQAQPWFGGGSGTSESPFIIENHIFEYSTGSGFCFGIVNSRKYFIINNCTFRNSNFGNIVILLFNVTYGQILNSYIYNSIADGMWIEDTSDTLISNNEVYDNSQSGIYMTGTSENNTISGNIFDNNGWYGIELDSSFSLIYDNYFINPGSDHAFDGSFFNNDWNNSVIGNYWDDYNGYDMDLDGIGDTPYDVPPGGASQDYLPIWNLQGPIVIDDLPSSLTDWSWAVNQAWCGGSGTELDPYIIENLNIDGYKADSCITILNSKAHFVIRGCTLNNSVYSVSDAGIYLFNVSNGHIIDNYFYHNQFSAIYLVSGGNNTVSGNFLHSNYFGIYIEGSENDVMDNNIYGYGNATGIYILGNYIHNTIDGNIVENCWQGILLMSGANNNTISGNTVFKNLQRGLYLYDSDFNYISENLVYNNTLDGLRVFSSDYNTIVGTVIHDNILNGIYLQDSDNNTIYDNIIRDNGNFGVSLDGTSNDNLIFENFFLSNVKHAIDNGANNNWNFTTIGNYWDNWTSPDVSPVDGIVDFPYNISGSAGNKDYLPIADDGPPSIIVNSPSADDIFDNNAPGFSLIITDDYLDETWYTIDGGVHNFTFTGSAGTIDQSAWDATLDGIITLRFYASDLPGNIGTAVVNIEKDSQAPTITITSPIVGAIFGASAPSFVVDITDVNLDSMWYSLDGGTTVFTFTNSNGTIDQTAWAALAEGPITITFYANDTVGNVGSESVDIIKDLPSPGDDFIIIIIITSIVVGAAVATAVTVVVLRKRKGVE